MFKIHKLKNWTYSSINDDKNELNAYQKMQDQFFSINNKIDEYIAELGYEDKRLFVEYNGKMIPIKMLRLLSETTLKNKELSAEESAYWNAEINRLYYKKLKELKDRIITLAVNETDNIYLAYINNCIKIINTLLKEYAHLLAVQRASIYSLDNSGNLNAGEKIKVLKDNIDIRTAEINTRLSAESRKR